MQYIRRITTEGQSIIWPPRGLSLRAQLQELTLQIRRRGGGGGGGRRKRRRNEREEGTGRRESGKERTHGRHFNGIGMKYCFFHLRAVSYWKDAFKATHTNIHFWLISATHFYIFCIFCLIIYKHNKSVYGSIRNFGGAVKCTKIQNNMLGQY